MPNATPTLHLYGAHQQEDTVTLGHFLRSQRERNTDLSTRQVAEAVNRSTSFIGMVERGERNMSPDLLMAMAPHYGLKAKIVKEAVVLSYTKPKKGTLRVEFHPSVIELPDQRDGMTHERLHRFRTIVHSMAERPWLIDHTYEALNKSSDLVE